MPKRTTAFTLALAPRESGASAAAWLSGALRQHILEGRLRPGARLPATRDLARQYGLARGTIVSAFDQLKAEGYVEGSVGSGTFVNETLPDELLRVPRTDAPGSAHKATRRRVSDFARRAALFAGFPTRPARAFRTDQPALDLFPTTLWAQLAARRLRRATASTLLGCEAVGYRPLREAVTDYLTASRGVRCDAGQVIIVGGAQEAFDLVSRVLVNRGDRVCMEEPGYRGAGLVFEAFGARVSGVPVDDQGMEVPRSRHDLRLAYVTPAHQFPVGVSMSLPRRLALLEWARATGALILEDDYDSEYRYSGRPLPALQGLDRHGSVLFVGTFSKVMFPSLRLGYLVVPTDLVDYFAAAKSIATRHAPVLEQAVLADFIADGHFGRHVRRMREVYARRLSVLLESAREHLAGMLEISSVEAGLQTVGWLGAGMSDVAMAKAAAERGVEVGPLSRYARGRAPRVGVQMGFAAVDERELRRGVRELAVAIETMPRRG